MAICGRRVELDAGVGSITGSALAGAAKPKAPTPRASVVVAAAAVAARRVRMFMWLAPLLLPGSQDRAPSPFPNFFLRLFFFYKLDTLTPLVNNFLENGFTY